MNRHEIEEYMKCANDIEYFAETYVKAWHPVNGLQSIKLNDFQKEAIKEFKEKKLFAKIAERQKGKTFVASLLLLHNSLFNDNKTSIIVSTKLDMGNHILLRINEMYDNLPEFLKMTKKIINNRRELEFENGSRIRSIGSNSNLMRGLTISNVYFDESEWIPEVDKMIVAFYPCLVVSGGKMFAFTSSRTLEAFRERRVAA